MGIQELCERLDSEIFSGDTFCDKDQRANFLKDVRRWIRHIKSIQAIETQECNFCDDDGTYGEEQENKDIHKVDCSHCGFDVYQREIQRMI